MSRYPELAAKVDAFFARVQARHGDQMKCGSGCSHCCHVRLTVTGVEAKALHAEISGWDPTRKAALAANAAASPPDRCAALDPDGHCLVYAGRPLVCRSHGAPIKIRNFKAPRATKKPPKLQVFSTCRENFVGDEPDVDPDCVYDQETVSTMLIAVDRAAGGDGSRIDLADVLAAATER